MLLALDCGNTNVAIGVFRGDELLGHWRLATNATRTEDEYFVLLRELFGSIGISTDDVDSMIVSSVVPGVNMALERLGNVHLHCRPLFVDHKTPTGIELRFDNPAEIGADRLVDTLAAHHAHPDRQVIVVDFGTATTFDSISADGAYLGGIICPGIEISQQALFAKASKLSNVSMYCPPHVIGTNTVDSLRSGILWGYGGMVDSLVLRMKEEMGGDPYVIATGGLAATVAEYSRQIDEVDDMLMIKGLKLLADKLF